MEDKTYTLKEIQEKLTDKFDKNAINYTDMNTEHGYNYIDDTFNEVFGLFVEVIKDLGIKVSE